MRDAILTHIELDMSVLLMQTANDKRQIIAMSWWPHKRLPARPDTRGRE